MTQSSLHDKGSSQDFYVLCETGRDPTDAVQPLPPLLWIRKDTHFRFWDLAVTQLYTSLSQQHKKQTGRISTAVSERRSTLLFLWKPRSITLLIVTNTAADLPHPKKLSKKFTRCSRIPFRHFARSRAAHLRFLGSRSLEGAISP